MLADQAPPGPWFCMATGGRGETAILFRWWANLCYFTTMSSPDNSLLSVTAWVSSLLVAKKKINISRIHVHYQSGKAEQNSAMDLAPEDNLFMLPAMSLVPLGSHHEATLPLTDSFTDPALTRPSELSSNVNFHAHLCIGQFERNPAKSF